MSKAITHKLKSIVAHDSNISSGGQYLKKHSNNQYEDYVIGKNIPLPAQ
jgi:hypothetical protein